MDAETDKLLRQGDVAARLGVTRATLLRWRASGRGPAWIQLEGAIRYRQSAISDYLDRQQKNGSAADAATA